jgi:hypothetical protein
VTDYSHLNALEHRLFNEECRLREASKPTEIDLRTVWVAGIKREIADEKALLGIETVSQDICDDELLAELGLA